MSSIRVLLEKTPPELLERMARADASTWCARSLFNSDGQRCLVGQLTYAADFTDAVRKLKLPVELIFNAAVRFDQLVRRFGLLRVVRATQARAQSVLSQQLELTLAR